MTIISSLRTGLPATRRTRPTIKTIALPLLPARSERGRSGARVRRWDNGLGLTGPARRTSLSACAVANWSQAVTGELSEEQSWWSDNKLHPLANNRTNDRTSD